MDFTKRILPSLTELNAVSDKFFEGRGADDISLILHLISVGDAVRAAVFSGLQQECELSEGRFILLVELKTKGRPLALTELADRTGVSAASCSIMVKRMLQEKQPLISKEINAECSKSVLIALTPYGEAIIEQALKSVFSCMQSTSALLSDKGKQELLTLLQKLYSKLQ